MLFLPFVIGCSFFGCCSCSACFWLISFFCVFVFFVPSFLLLLLVVVVVGGVMVGNVGFCFRRVSDGFGIQLLHGVDRFQMFKGLFSRFCVSSFVEVERGGPQIIVELYN